MPLHPGDAGGALRRSHKLCSVVKNHTRLQLIQVNNNISSRTMTVLEVIGLVAQLSGLHAIMLIKFLVVHLLQIPQCEVECAKLDESVRKLRALLQCQAPILDVATQLLAMATETLVEVVGCNMASQLLASANEMLDVAAGLDEATQLLANAAKTVVEADGLVGSYRLSKFWCRVLTSRSMVAQLRVMQDRVNRLCVLVPATNFRTVTVHPVSDTTTNATVISHPLHGTETSDSQRFNNATGLGGTDDQSDNTEPEEYLSSVV